MFPFSAIVGQDDMKQALMIAAVDSAIGGVLLFGDRGTGKSTAVRALADLLPKMRAVVGCPYACEPESNYCAAAHCGIGRGTTARKDRLVPVPFPAESRFDLLADSLESLSRLRVPMQRSLAAWANKYSVSVWCRSDRWPVPNHSRVSSSLW